MFDSMFGKSFNSGKCKTLLRLAVSRIKLLKNKRDIQVKQMRKDLAQLLQSSQESSAWIRVEHIIREQNMMAAYEIVELFCELIVVRLPIIESQRGCPIDLREAISSLIFAAPRCADLPELLQIRTLFATKYGKEFVAAAAELRPDCGVNRRIIEKLSVRAPAGETKLKLMKDIAAEQNVDWDPTESESELLKLPEDLLEGSNQFLGASQIPILVAPKQHSTSVDSPIQERQNQLLGPTLNPISAANKQLSMPETRKSLDHNSPKGGEVLAGQAGKSAECATAAAGAAADEFQDANQIRVSFPAKQELMSRSHGYDFPKDGGFQDIAMAARAAVESAERAAAAARAAASLASVRFSGKGSYQSNVVGSDSESDEEIPRSEAKFRDDDVSKNTWPLESHVPERPLFDKYSDSQREKRNRPKPLKGTGELKRETFSSDDEDQSDSPGDQFISRPNNGSRFNTEMFPQQQHPDHIRQAHVDDEAAGYQTFLNVPTFDDSPTNLHNGQQPNQEDFATDQTEPISYPPQRPPPGIPKFNNAQGSMLQQNGSFKTPHLHPKLPNYDDLAARFEALKSKR